MATAVQAIIYSKRKFTRGYVEEAAERYKGRLDEGRDYWRLRVRDPAQLRRAGYRRFRLKTVKPGVKAIVAAKGPSTRDVMKRVWTYS